MKRMGLALALCLLLTGKVLAQGGMGPGPGMVHSTGAGYTGPGDVVSSASGWWGLRAYNAAYAAATGNIADLVAVTGGGAVCTLKAATDGTADIVGTYCAGSLTVPAACAAASGGSCKVAKLYDQTGNSRDAAQGTLATMPSIVFGPVTGLAANRPAMTFASQNLLTPITFNIAQPLTLSTVVIRTSGTSDSGTIAGSQGNDADVMFRGANVAAIFAGSFAPTVAQTDNAWHSAHGVFNGASSFVNIDGTSGSSGSPGANGLTPNRGIYFGRDGFANALTGNIVEGGVWPSAISAGNVASIATNQKSYWGF